MRSNKHEAKLDFTDAAMYLNLLLLCLMPLKCKVLCLHLEERLFQ